MSYCRWFYACEMEIGKVTSRRIKQGRRWKPCDGHDVPNRSTSVSLVASMFTLIVDILNTLYASLSPLLPENHHDILQRIRDHFYHRRFRDIFENPAHLPVYAAAYVPLRGLCYRKIFIELEATLGVLKERKGGEERRVVCLGAGAGSELVGALSAYAQVNQTLNSKRKDPGEGDQMVVTADSIASMVIHIQDLSPYWSPVLDAIHASTCCEFRIDSSKVKMEFSHGDLVAFPDELRQQIKQATLVTAAFVLNEVIQDKAQGMTLVRGLAESMRPNSYLLIIDSAGSFSNFVVNGKTYAVWMLFDAMKGVFERVRAEDATWFRPGKNLKWPVEGVEVQNMRYFLRLYRKI